MRALVALGLAALLGGCATNSVTLLNDEGVATSGKLAVLDPKTGAERGELDAANTTATLGGRSLHVRPMKTSLFGDLLSRVPYPPRTYVLYFYEGTSDLTDESKPILEALRKVVTPASDVQITGHTDTVGDSASNDKLSYDRAVEVRAALVKDGLPVENSRVTGRGERELRVPTPDNVAEPANRRVEVILR